MRVEPDNAIANGDVGWARVISTNGKAIVDFVVSRKDDRAATQDRPNILTRDADSIWIGRLDFRAGA